MKIEKKIIKKQEEIQFYVEELSQYFDSEQDAKLAIKEYNKEKENRLKDFEICQKLFGWIWIHCYGYNWLVKNTEGVRKDIKTGWIEAGKNEELEINLYGDDYHPAPPKFDHYDNFLTLFCKLNEKGFKMEFNLQNNGLICFLIVSDGIKIESRVVREEKHWANEYLLVLGLKDLAYKYCLTLDK